MTCPAVHPRGRCDIDGLHTRHRATWDHHRLWPVGRSVVYWGPHPPHETDAGANDAPK